jgi:2-polyprenyl-3-methyl-5-hydroxy-6-metoxy-1,4-benzoquinol methylase
LDEDLGKAGESMTERKSWGDYYADSGGVDYLLDHLVIHKDFFKEVLKRSPKTALEAGCGSAIMSIFMAMCGVQMTACDRDAEVLAKAAENVKNWHTNVIFSKQNLLELSFKDNTFDVVFSQGVLEHMNDEQIRKSCQESLRVSPSFVFSVPSYYYNHKDFGDERLLREAEWGKILSGIGKLEMHPYFPLRVKRNFLIKRPLMLLGILTR